MPLADRYTSRPRAAGRFVAQRMLLKPVAWSVVDVTVTGQENLAGFHGAAVVVSNHSSHLDTPLIIGALPRRLGVSVATGAAADYFFQVKWRKPLTQLFFNAFPIDRSGHRGRNGLTTTLLDSGVPILLFPEGTRSRTGVISRFSAGTAALCITRGVPCLPLALVGAYEAWPKGRSWVRPGRPPVHVSIGAPLYAEPGETPRDFSARMAERVRSLYDERATVMGLPTQHERELALQARLGGERELTDPTDPAQTGSAAEPGVDHPDPGEAPPDQPTHDEESS